MQYPPVSKKEAKRALGYLEHHHHRLTMYVGFHPEDEPAKKKADATKDAIEIVKEYIKCFEI